MRRFSRVGLAWGIVAMAILLLFGNAALLAQTKEEAAEFQAAWKKGNELSDQGRYSEAVPCFEKVLELTTKVHGAESSEAADILGILAGLHINMAQNSKAEALSLRCLEIKEAKLGKEHRDVSRALNNLAILYEDMGQYGKAEPLYLRSLQIKEAKLGKDDPEVANTLCNLGALAEASGQYARAEALYLRGLQIYELKLGKDHPEVALPLNNLGGLYTGMGLYAKAEPLYLRSLQIYELKLGKDHPDLALPLNNLSEHYRLRGQYEKSGLLCQRALQIRESKLGKDHPDVADTLDTLANLYRNTSDYTKAGPLYQRSLEIYEAKLGKDHPKVAMTLIHLGNLYKDMGETAKAEPLYQRGLEIYETKLGKDHPAIADCLNNLAQLYAAKEQWNEATRVTTRLRQLVRLHVHRTLPVLSDREQLVFLENTEAERLNVALSLGVELRTNRDQTVASAAWLLNSKAIAQESLSDRTRMALASTDPQMEKVASQLTSVRQQLAAFTVATPRPGQEAAVMGQIAKLSEQEQQLARALGQLIGQPTRTDPWVTVEEIRRALPADGIFIDITRFRVLNFKEFRWKDERYAAWLIPPAGRGEVQIIDLGDAAEIDSAIATVRKGLLAAQGSATQKSIIAEKGEAEAEKALQPALAALAKRLLEPMAEQIKDRQQWLVSPDGPLWLVPWAALRLDDKSYVVEKHTLTYLVSGRELATPTFVGKIKHSAPRILADADFDLDPKEAATITASLLGKPVPANNSSVAGVNETPGARSASLIGRVGRLPGTAAEAVAIKPKLQTYAGEEPWMYRGKNAVEGAVKAWRSPKVMVLSTHGYFLDAQEVRRSDRADPTGAQRPALDKDGNLLENPLLRCGLLLAGCNERARATGQQEDGVLTGLEIVGCDLRGTELVVLSACETGLGQVRNGEGVAGLRQAFQLAGAQTIVASLWQVPDKDTALLMNDFFDGLSKGKSKADALREAQLARIKAHRNRDEAAHPFFWGAFTLTGQ